MLFVAILVIPCKLITPPLTSILNNWNLSSSLYVLGHAVEDVVGALNITVLFSIYNCPSTPPASQTVSSLAPFKLSYVYSVQRKSTLATLVTVLVKNSWSVERGTENVIVPLEVPLLVTP